MAEIGIRPFEERDYPGMLAVGNAVFPDYPFSEKEQRHDDARYDGARLVLRRLVAELPGGTLAGLGEYHHAPQMYHPQKFFVLVEVHPDHRHQGIGTRLYDALMDQLAPVDPLVLWSWARETSEESVRFAAARGFHETRRAWESRLDVGSFDPAPFESRAETALRGLQNTTVAEERDHDPDWLPKTYEMHQEVAADVPQPAPFTPQTLGEFTDRLINNPGYIPEAHFLVKEDGGRYVAESFMFTSHELPDVLYQGLTATRREYRGRGVALAVKLRTIEYARARGIREIRTWNDTMNEPMLRINTALGFVRQPAWITFEKRVREV